MNFTAAILTYNEEKYIARCLNSLLWADEILVIDSESTDQTVQICNDSTQPWNQPGAAKLRLLTRKWTGFKDQRNFTLEQATHDWIFVVDADEACSPELATKIQELLRHESLHPFGPPFRAYKIRRIEYFLGKEIKYGIWNPSYQDRFFHRAGVKYINDIHEYPLFPQPPSEIHEPLYHAPDFGPEKFLNKMNRYTTLEARDRIQQGQRTSLYQLLGAFPSMFFKNLFYYSAYKDGIHGILISLLEGVSRVVRHIKMWEYGRK